MYLLAKMKLFKIINKTFEHIIIAEDTEFVTLENKGEVIGVRWGKEHFYDSAIVKVENNSHMRHVLVGRLFPWPGLWK